MFSYLRIERNEMNWVKLNSENLRQIIAKDFLEYLEQKIPNKGKLGKVYMEPKTWMGSRQYYQRCYADLMTIVRQKGNPTWYCIFFE